MAYAQVLEALGDPTRREIFELLRKGPMPVGEIARHLPVSRPAVSQHLRVLKEAGLVADRQEGTRRVYSIEPAGLAETRAWFDQMWDRSLAAFKEAAEADGGPAPRRRRRR
jgi:DNA-binding transcriptional ArsR family regulator